MKRGELRCIPPDRSTTCDQPAEWYVWFKDTPLYTYACDAHRQEYEDTYRTTATPVVQVTRIVYDDGQH